jgi:cytidylate kinase
LAPLKPADDAIVIDTTHLSIDAVLETMLNHIREFSHS